MQGPTGQTCTSGASCAISVRNFWRIATFPPSSPSLAVLKALIGIFTADLVEAGGLEILPGEDGGNSGEHLQPGGRGRAEDAPG